MTFRVLFEKYQAGAATEEERRLVEEELEKTALLNEHLFGTWEEPSAEPPAGELKQVKRSLRKRNIALVLTSVAVVLALLLSVPLAERAYFDPNQATWSEEMTDLEIALDCYYSLFAPRQFCQGVETVTDTGFASWSMELSFWDREALGHTDYLTATVSRDELRFPSGTLYYVPSDIFDMGPVCPSGNWKDAALEHLKWQLREVDKDADVYGAVSFAADLSAGELMELIRSYEVSVEWAGVRVGHPTVPQTPLVGMRLNRWREDVGVNAAYPELLGHVTAQNAEQHFRSMLNYCRDYEQNTVNIGVVEDSGYYDKVLEELDEGGLRFFGCMMAAKPEVYYRLAEDGYITDFRTLEVWDHTIYAYVAPSFGG